jgi:hypothetical protein
MHQAAVTPTLKMLATLDRLLDKAAAYATARKLDEPKLLQARLYPDMLPLVQQIQIVSDTAKGLVGRLAGKEVPSFPDTETTIAELKARLAKTADFIKGLQPSDFDGAETRTLTLPIGGGKTMEMSGLDFVLGRGTANFYFHVVTAYDIMRHIGVEVGKRDYLG